MASQSVLISGANGHLGFRIVVSALTAGHKVRAVIRRQAVATQLKTAKSIQPYLSNFEVVIIEDLLKEGAFDAAVVGMDSVIHVASPLTKQTEKTFEDVIQPAVQMTMGVVRSAAKAKSVKRIVIMSSVVALDVGKSGRLGAMDLGPVPDPHANFSPFEAYTASKRLARAESMKFVAENKPGFDIINILPSVILGPNELSTSASSIEAAGTNRYVIGIALGTSQLLKPVSGSVHVNDCADLHVRALDPAIKGGQDFIASANDVDWTNNLVSDIVRKNFPSEVESGILKLNGEISGLESYFDASKTEEVFTIKWIGYEEQVKSVIAQYLELKKMEGSA